MHPSSSSSSLFSSVFLLSSLSLALACNKALCASDVSKCLIQELCQCRPADGNCSCCKECMLCLGSLWEECCDCVGMCNPRSGNESPATAMSTVEELLRPIPSLFRALTEGEPPMSMVVMSFPVSEELSFRHSMLAYTHPSEGVLGSPEGVVGSPDGSEEVEDSHSHMLHNDSLSLAGNSIHSSFDTQDKMCTVVYFDECLSIRQCKFYCESMGGSKYRWFHNACCQCIGPECLDYGSKAVQCVNCLI
ncbi:hypothetical protein DNTS_015337 [Danionella cerebrum]|uniref:Twisted gastrulation protein homolog 1 n=1 Tax=Danionella cerebrum TaxID=2873325 RepID=A0A553NWR2_9TELE|nr:hypothetical protein DNTS_015337 [Danionella translucida]